MLTVVGKFFGQGHRHFKRRMTDFPEVFRRATGEYLFPGTLNVTVEHEIPVQEHFRIKGVEIDEPDQDLLFEVCRIDGLWAYRIRPLNLLHRGGGHGDDVIEIACAVELRSRPEFDPENIELDFFR